MGNLRRWSSTATGNASVAGGANTINFAEGQTPGSVNNSAREVMAQVRGIYTPSEWGWVEFSATASVASQTAFKLTGNQTSDWTAGRRWRLKSGSSTRYGSVVSSSFTAETTITVTVDSGSLSASHSLAALAAIDSNHVPTNRVIEVTDNTNAALRVTQLGTGLALRIEDSANPDASAFVVTAAGDVGIGTTAPSAAFQGSTPRVGIEADRSGADQTLLNLAHTGTISSSDKINIGFDSFSTTAVRRTMAQISALNENPAAGNPGSLIFYTNAGAASLTERMRIDSSGNVGIGASAGGYKFVVSDGTTTLVMNPGGAIGYAGVSTNHPYVLLTNNTERMRIDASGNVLVTGAGGLGYGTGSGGTVTQITSKATGVTLNKTNGQIVTHNANINSGGEVSFVVTNSTVAATDVVIVHRASGGTNEVYSVFCDAVSAGSFRVCISNVSAAGAAEALTLNFAVIKAVTS